MSAHHVAYGLELQTSFPLLGLRPTRQDGLPSLALQLLASEKLDAAWSGPSGPPAWIGRLGDGCALTIARGRAGDVLFGYGDRARFLLDPKREHLLCAPESPGLHWQQVLLGRVLPNVALMRGYEALHASAVESPAGVVAIAAPSGTGKTTLALEFLRRGWPLFADDVLVLGAGADEAGAIAHPGTPLMNVAAAIPTALAGAELGETLGTLAGERWTAVHATAGEPRKVRAVCLLERGPDLSPLARTLPPNPLALAPYMLGLADGPLRERQRFARYADLMSHASLVRVACDAATTPATAADLIEERLDESPALVAGAGR